MDFFSGLLEIVFPLSILVALLAAAPPAPTDSGPGKAVVVQGNDHIPTPQSPHPPYSSIPPTSGPHVPYIARWGIYDRPVPPEVQVHNLEDGGVLLQYDCPKPCPELARELEQIAMGFDRIIVAPHPGIGSRIALTAWGRIDKMERLDRERILRFIKAYIGIDHHPASE